MFYWFYRTTHPDGHLRAPIILWLQGGPGIPGSSHGNFLMFGPLDQHLQPREVPWTNTANLLFIDSPVGTGYSYVQDESFIPDNMQQICADIINMLRVFMHEHPYYQELPFYIFGQSYGGKTTAALTYYLMKAVDRNELRCNLKAGMTNFQFWGKKHIDIKLLLLSYILCNFPSFTRKKQCEKEVIY